MPTHERRKRGIEKPRGRRTMSRAIVIGLLILLVATFYTNRMFLSGVNPGEDLAEFDIPHARFFADSVRAGRYPFWDPYKVCGLPFTETSFMGPLYPLSILYVLMPVGRAIGMGFVIHIVMSGVATYFLALRLRLRVPSAFFCAATWMLSSVFIQYSESGWLSETISAAYLPLLIYLCALLAEPQRDRRRAMRLTLIAGLVLGLLVLGGKPDYTYVTILCAAAFCLPFLRNRRFLLCAGAATALAALVSLPTWAPLARQLSGPGIEMPYAAHGYRPSHLLNLPTPFSVRRAFVGRPALLLFVVGFWNRRFKHKTGLLAMMSVSFVFMFGDLRLGALRLVELIPFASRAEYLWPWHTGLILGLALLAGAGLDVILRTERMGRRISSALALTLIAVQLADLWHFCRVFHPRSFQYSVADFYPDTSRLKPFIGSGQLVRVYQDVSSPRAYVTNQSMMDGFCVLDAWTRGISLHRFAYIRRLSSHPVMFDTFFRTAPPEILGLCNVGYVITDRGLPSDNYRLIQREVAQARGRSSHLYAFRPVFPRAFLIPEAGASPAFTELLANPPDALILARVSPALRTLLSRYRNVQKIDWSPERYRISVASPGGGFLFLSEMFDSGWQARIDGKPSEIHRPFGFFMGVFVKSGEHEIEFRFRPTRLYVYLLISAMAALGSVVCLAFLTGRRKTGRRPPSSV